MLMAYLQSIRAKSKKQRNLKQKAQPAMQPEKLTAHHFP